MLQAAETVRLRILKEHGRGVLPECYTGRCTCNFLDSLRRKVADSITETAIYTRYDGIVDWRYCMTMKPEVDVEVPGTHIGMAFNPAAYAVIAERLASAQSPREDQPTCSSTAPLAVSSRSASRPPLSIRMDAAARLLFTTSKLPLQSVFV